MRQNMRCLVGLLLVDDAHQKKRKGDQARVGGIINMMELLRELVVTARAGNSFVHAALARKSNKTTGIMYLIYLIVF